MLKVQGWLPEFDTAMLSAGEQSGKLEFSFKSLGEYYATRAKSFAKSSRTVAVATLNLHVFLLVFPLSHLIGFAMGLLNNDYSLCIPFIVQKIKFYGILWGSIIFFIFACQGKHGERWRAFLEYLNQAVPLLRTALKYLVLFRFTTALDALLNSGISIIKGLPMAAAASASPHLKQSIATWPPKLETGTTPAELVRQEYYFPEMFVNLYHTGEISGNLDDSIKRLKTYYYDEGIRLLRMFMRIFSRGLYLLIALMIAYNVIGFYKGYFSPIFN